MALSDYLAKHYLNASTAASSDPSDTRPSKKRKKNKSNRNETTESLLIADDDDDLLLSSRKANNQGDDENDTPTLFDTKVRSAEFRKSKKNAWQSLPTSDSNQPPHSQQEDEADILLRQQLASTAESRLNLEAENAPTIVETSPPKVQSGIRPGLQTAADTARLLEEEEAAAQAEAEKEAQSKRSRTKSSKPNPEDEAEETIYRDATGRRIDLSLRRAEARQAELAKQALEKKNREDAMGEVQLRQREERKQDLSNAKFLTLARTVDDEEYNSSLRQKLHWDDPMAGYMASQRPPTSSTGEDEDERGTDKSTNPARRKRREYAGAAPPNRYGIKPGWRWDGVDRANGFEKEWFQARGRKARNEKLEYQWQMDE